MSFNQLQNVTSCITLISSSVTFETIFIFPFLFLPGFQNAASRIIIFPCLSTFHHILSFLLTSFRKWLFVMFLSLFVSLGYIYLVFFLRFQKVTFRITIIIFFNCVHFTCFRPINQFDNIAFHFHFISPFVSLIYIYFVISFN